MIVKTSRTSCPAHLITDSTLTLVTKQRPIIAWAGKSARQLSISGILSDVLNTLCSDTHQVSTLQTSSSYFENIQMTPIINFLFLAEVHEATYSIKVSCWLRDNIMTILHRLLAVNHEQNSQTIQFLPQSYENCLMLCRK